MGIINTKKKEEVKKEPKTKAKAEFRILIWTKVAGSRRLVKKFDANRFVDEDKVPFIYNEELKFMELYPQDMKKSIKMTDAEIKTKIKSIEKKLEDIRKKDIEDYKEDEPNTLDLEQQLMILTAKLRYSYYTEDDNAYEYYDDEGRVCIDFLRKGNTFFPLKCDLDTNTIHTASEPVVKKAGILLRNKENKYLPKKLIETSTLILLAIVIIGTIANLFFGGWLWTKYDESGLAELQRDQIELTNICSQIVVENAKAVNEMANTVINGIEGETTTVIEGITP
jgi:hypothetical protein